MNCFYTATGVFFLFATIDRFSVN